MLANEWINQQAEHGKKAFNVICLKKPQVMSSVMWFWNSTMNRFLHVAPLLL